MGYLPKDKQVRDRFVTNKEQEATPLMEIEARAARDQKQTQEEGGSAERERPRRGKTALTTLIWSEIKTNKFKLGNQEATKECCHRGLRWMHLCHRTSKTSALEGRRQLQVLKTEYSCLVPKMLIPDSSALQTLPRRQELYWRPL